MTSFERVMTALSHREPDRVPFFLLATMHGARELGLSIEDYFSKAGNVVEGQLRLQAKYRSDCYYGFFYAPLEVEAWGGEVLYTDDGPPNTGMPCITSFDRIRSLSTPDIGRTPCLGKVLTALSELRKRAAGTIPVIGVVMSPFSLPVMQMGFEKYIQLIHEEPELFAALMRVNEEFCVAWANAQLAAGADAICYFDPVSSTTILPRERYLDTGHKIGTRTIGRIKGPTATHLASGRGMTIYDDIARTGTAIVGVSVEEDLGNIKAVCKGKLTVLGNLNGVAMRTWTPAQAEAAVKEAVMKAGHGGGFILSDNHGEIPFQVPDDTLLAISNAVQTWGTYPLRS